MNLKEEKYSRYALVREMMETPDIIRAFNPSAAAPFAGDVRKSKGLFLTGEGSSRIFPAKRAITSNLKRKTAFPIMTEGSTQAEEYNLNDYAVFLASNSGKTKEVIRLATTLKSKGHKQIFGLTANQGTKLAEIASGTHVLTCGKEDAVAATKSVVEQGMFYDSLLRTINGENMRGLKDLSEKSEKALTLKIDADIIAIIKK